MSAGFHLRVAGHHDRYIDVLIARPFVAGRDGAADALIDLVTDKVDPPVESLELFGDFRRAIGRAVVDDADMAHFRRHGGEYLAYLGFLVVARHYDANGSINCHMRTQIVTNDRGETSRQRSSASITRWARTRPSPGQLGKLIMLRPQRAALGHEPKCTS